MSVETRPMTAEVLEQRSIEDGHVELVRGVLVKMPPAGGEHGGTAGTIAGLLWEFSHPRWLGKVYVADTGFVLARNPDTVRAPDVAFVSAERVARQRRPQGFFEVPPDLAVEVVSPSDTDEDVEEKVLDYLQASTNMVWVVRPRTKTLSVYRSFKEVQLLTVQDTLEGGDVLSGVSVPVKEIFEF